MINVENLQAVDKLAAIAGLGGLSLGLLALVFRDVIRKNIFPTLAQAQAFRLIRLILILTFSISALGLASLVYIKSKVHNPSEEEQIVFLKENPELTIRVHLALVDEEKYLEAYNQLSLAAKVRIQQDIFLSAFENQRKPQGKVVSRKLYGVQMLRQLPDQIKGVFANVTYSTRFAIGGNFLESLTVIGESGSWKILSHQINPCVPPVCKAD